MKKIMFNDRYGLTQAVIEGRKTMTRRIIIPQPDFLSDNFGWAKRNNGDVILPKYGVGEVVAVAQSYEQAGIQLKDTPREAFASLIDKVYGRGTWKSNPWVVVYEFELVK